uniref:Tumor necrosis factor receptor superfamily member 12A n=1 Tax=Varanus komodoensis TaxID=61221 RepID=A0A8D2J2Y1_VARKO
PQPAPLSPRQLRARPTVCPGGQSWSPDLEKCMDCSVCQRQNKNDFCSTCEWLASKLYPPLGASLGAVVLAGIIGGIIIYARCRRREKFTTPIEETGAKYVCRGVI